MENSVAIPKLQYEDLCNEVGQLAGLTFGLTIAFEENQPDKTMMLGLQHIAHQLLDMYDKMDSLKAQE